MTRKEEHSTKICLERKAQNLVFLKLGPGGVGFVCPVASELSPRYREVKIENERNFAEIRFVPLHRDYFVVIRYGLEAELKYEESKCLQRIFTIYL